MKIKTTCNKYFNGFQNVFGNSKPKTKALGALKIASYFTGIIPLGFATALCASSLSGRIKKQRVTPSFVNNESINVESFSFNIRNGNTNISFKGGNTNAQWNLYQSTIYDDKPAEGTPKELLDKVEHIIQTLDPELEKQNGKNVI